jgi:hypothetical protein
LTSKEILETRINIASIIKVPPDNVRFMYAKGYSKPYWFFSEDEKYNTILFFSEKPLDFEIIEEIKYMEEVAKEWDEEDII